MKRPNYVVISRIRKSAIIAESRRKTARESLRDNDDTISSKAYSYDNVSAAIEKASGFVGTVWVTFLSVGAYLAIATASVTHIQLFHETPIKLPFFDAYLPLVAFFWFTPILFTILHFYLLLQVVVLTEKIHRYNDLLRDAGLDETVRKRLRQLLPNDLLVQFLAGPKSRREGILGFLYRLVAWMTIVAGPIILLLLIQYKFLPFQSVVVTWTNRCAIIIDLIMIWTLWLPYTGRLRTYTLWQWHLVTYRGVFQDVSGTIFVLAVCFVVLTFPGEWLDKFPVQQIFHRTFSRQFPIADLDAHEQAELANETWLYRTVESHLPTLSSRDEALSSWLKRVPEARRLIPGSLKLPEAVLADVQKLKDSDGQGATASDNPWDSVRTETFSPRNFVAANLFRADLRKMDFQDSRFDRANLVYAKLDGVLMKRTSLNGASIDFAQINGASLDGADLKGATLGVTKLRNTSLDHADLRGAWLYAAVLDGSSLSGALLQGATLDEASLQGSVLGLGQLQGASLIGTRLQGARLDSASLIGASLNGAQLQGAGLDSADLEGADLEGAKLEGALLDNARLQGSHLDKAELQSASLVASYVFGASGHANFDGARFEHVITDAVYPVLFKNIVPITEAVVKEWISAAIVGVDDDSRRKIIVKRLEPLNSLIRGSVRDNDWSALERSAPSATEYQKDLTNELIILSCDKLLAPYLTEGLLRSASPEQFGRAYMTGPYFFIYLGVLRSGRKVATNCPGSNLLTDKDWERLDQLSKAPADTDPSRIVELACDGAAAPIVARAFLRAGTLAEFHDKFDETIVKMKAARSKLETCPGVAKFSDDDWKELAAIPDRAPAKTSLLQK